MRERLGKINQDDIKDGFELAVLISIFAISVISITPS